MTHSCSTATLNLLSCRNVKMADKLECTDIKAEKGWARGELVFSLGKKGVPDTEHKLGL